MLAFFGKNPRFLDNFPSNLKLVSLFCGKDISLLFFDSFRYRVKVFLYVIFYVIVSLKSNFFDVPKLPKFLKIPKICGESFFIIRMEYINYANIKTYAIVYHFKGFLKKTKKLLFFASKNADIGINFS